IYLNLKGEATVKILEQTQTTPDPNQRQWHGSLYHSRSKSRTEREYHTHIYTSSETLLNIENFLLGWKTRSAAGRGKPKMISSKKNIAITGHLDLSSMPEASQPGENVESKIFMKSWSFFCFGFGCKSKPLTLRVRTPNKPSWWSVDASSARKDEEAHNSPSWWSQKSQSRPKSGDNEIWRGELVVPPLGVVTPTKLGGKCGFIDVEFEHMSKVAVTVTWNSPPKSSSEHAVLPSRQCKLNFENYCNRKWIAN
ncbi:hypothetical protein Ocin01_18642, partial [Orchesella cincta]